MRSDSEDRITDSSTAREGPENAPDLVNPCCTGSPKENRCFKENININKYGASNLSLEPQQMKKKKKGGKHNLRKSLAWDRAFFTNEGVLDPLELSAISGVSCRGGLDLISEDTPVSSGQDEDFGRDKKTNQSSPNFSNRISSTVLASPKVPTSAGTKFGSNFRGCPRPLASPSLKRRANANANAANAMIKDLKLPKVPGLKPGLSATCATTRSAALRGSNVKYNQIPQPDFSIQRDAELRSSSKSHKKTENTSRVYTPQSACHSDGSLGGSSLSKHLSFSMSPITVEKAYNSSPKTIPVNVTQIRPDNSCESQPYDSATFAASHSQNGNVSGGVLHPSQNQTMKPSRLRMPSPSLSFFSQPKPSVFRDLPLRDTDAYFIGSRNTGNLRLQDKLSRTTKSCDKIPESRISSSKPICSRPESTASSHVDITELVKPNSECDPTYEVGLKVLSNVSKSHLIGNKIFEDKNDVVAQLQGRHKLKITTRALHEEAELQKTGNEVPSENGSFGQAMDNFLENTIDSCTTKGKSCPSEWRNEELESKQSCATLESRTSSAIDELYEIKSRCNIVVLDLDSAQRTDGFDDRVQKTLAMHSGRKTSKRDCHEARLEETDPLNYYLIENDKRIDDNILNSKERASEQLDDSQLNRTYSSGNMKLLERGKAMAESPYVVSKQESNIKVFTNNSPAAEASMQNSVLSSTVGGSISNSYIMPEVGNGINQPDESPQVQGFHQIDKWNMRDSMLAEKPLHLQNSKPEENIDELLLVMPDLKDRKEVIDTKVLLSSSLGKRHKNSAANSFSSLSCSSQTSTGFDYDAGTSYGNLSDFLRQVTQSSEINDSLLPENKMHQMTPEDIREKTEEVPRIQVRSTDNELTSTISRNNSESEVSVLKDLEDIRALPVLLSESTILENCCFQESESLLLAGDEFVAENLSHMVDCTQAKHLPSVYSAVNAVGGEEDSVASQREISQSISRSSSPTNESPLKHETCNDEHETGDVVSDAIIDPSRVEPFSDSIMVTVSGDADHFLSRLPHKLDHEVHDEVETTLLPNNQHGDGLDENKKLLFVIPPNAVPFSDEWLAAMEAAGEDILTRKSGAVQNSPPDKPLLEPSPWSPVKKKNNQITPFDCTKFTAPSES